MAVAGEDVRLVARGEHLRALRAAGGVRVIDSEGERVVAVPCFGPEDPIDAVDVVILTAKAHDLAAMLPQIRAAMANDASVVAAQNGIPWWYFQHHGGELDGLTLQSVDKGGVLASAFDPDVVVGCVIYCPIDLTAPGAVHHHGPRRLELGRPDGQLTPRLEQLAAAFQRAGFEAPTSRNLRQEIWVKLLGNASGNPIAALVRKSPGEIAEQPAGQHVMRDIMNECVAVARATGLEVKISVDQRIARIPQQVGRHKPSMLQDVERGRRLELDPLVGAVVELGDRLGVDVSTLRNVYLLAQLI
jgi:2-dehydropantoate 2-reductase